MQDARPAINCDADARLATQSNLLVSAGRSLMTASPEESELDTRRAHERLRVQHPTLSSVSFAFRRGHALAVNLEAAIPTRHGLEIVAFQLRFLVNLPKRPRRLLRWGGAAFGSADPPSHTRSPAGCEAKRAFNVNPAITVKWMKEHTPNLPAVFDGLRKAGLPEE